MLIQVADRNAFVRHFFIFVMTTFLGLDFVNVYRVTFEDLSSAVKLLVRLLASQPEVISIRFKAV